MQKDLYFIAILAPEPILSEVLDFKLSMQKDFGCKHALKSPAHITLFPPFRSDAYTVDEIEIELHNLVSAYNSFNISLYNFNHFSNRVLYIDIEKNIKLNILGKRVIELMGKKFTTKPRSPFHPHMTIATRDLTEENFSVAWKKYSSVIYKREFIAHEITILRHNGKIWENYKTISLNC